MTYHTILKWQLILCAVLISLNVAAQQPVNNIIASKKTNDGRYNFLKFKTGGQAQNVSKQPEEIKKLLGLGLRHSFAADETVNNNAAFKRDVYGADHTRYNQYFNGVKVEYGVITLHSKNGALTILTGDYFNIAENFSTTPILSEKTALNKAISFIGAKKYSWQDSSISNKTLKSIPKGELVICRNYNDQSKTTNTSSQMELAYKFAVYATEPLRYDYIYVSAQTGNVIHVNPIIKHVSGTAATRYSGSKTISTTQIAGGNYILRDTTGNYNIATYNLNRSSNYSSAGNFTDNDNNWTADEYNNSNFDNAALDAHWGAMMTLDYWRTVHNRSSFDNKGARINNYVHYGNLYPNAFWDGYEMTYGDGDGSTLFPFTSVDICGHEIGHAVCQYTANLVYSYESGAINEGFSDIWGACIKRYADPSKNTWLEGDEISSTANPFRSMSNPKSEGQPDTYRGVNWYTGNGDNGGVHYNSGVMNHWFYMLSEGKTGTNDNGKSYNVTGIGITKAAQIAYCAENIYLYPNAVYADARISTIQAAEDLFGAGSNEASQTTAAWNAVGVNDVLAVPDSVTAAIVNNNVTVNWRFNTFQNVTGFAIQRAINGTNLFATIATVGAGVRSFIDTAYINNAFNQYRIRSFRDSLYSDYSGITSVSIGNAPFIMTNGTFTKCGVTFFDPGGPGNYSAGYYTTTIRPATAGNKVQVAFSEYNTGYDYLYIYNGPSSSSPLLGVYNYYTTPTVLQSTAPGGELTFVFNPYYSNSYSGWKAFITCFKPVTPPGNLAANADSLKVVHLSWTDNAADETSYVVERSLNDSLHFQKVITLSANSATYNDTSAPGNSYLFYRVRAYRDTIGSAYSNVISVTNGNSYTMQNGNVTTCGITFLDPGGIGNYSGGNYTTTFSPATAGNKLKVSFNQFNVNYDNLYIYDGPSSNSPLLGAYTGSTLSPDLQSSAAGGELTFVFNPYYYSSGAGWMAYISCYKPVATPGNLAGTKNGVKNVRLTWTDNASDETSYVVERSLNDSLHYLPLVTLTANTTIYNDTSAPDNNYIFYRVKAYRQSVSSPNSNQVFIINGNVFIMQNQNGSYTTCGASFLDPGGTNNYNNGYYSATIKPAVAGNNLRVAFSQFNVSYDNLYVYNGPSSSSPLLGMYSGSTLPPVLQSTAAGGELTFVFNSYYSNYSTGWEAYISCYKPVSAPSGLKATTANSSKINLSWTDNANDETKYVVERSVNSQSLYIQIAVLPANSSQYTDTAAPVNSILYYRVRAFRDSLASLYSDTASIAFGNAPFFMKDSTVVTCDKIFMDPAGFDIIPQNIYYNVQSTFKPAVNGNNIKVVFSKFRLNGYLYVYNGSNTSSPLIGYYSSYASAPTIFNGTGADGSLTFVYQGYSYGDSGWVAQVNCYKPVAKPSGVKAITDNSNRIKITWTDNADDETKYVVERSVNASSLFASVAQLAANTTQFTDSLAPANSLLYYRVKAYRDTSGSFYSDTASINFGNAPFLMKDSTLITCDKVFMDPGGADITPSGYYNNIVTFKPAIPGNNIRVSFSKFKIFGYLSVYNGSSSGSPLIGTYDYSTPSPGVILGTGPEGSVTFVYQGYPDSGWVAQVSCYKPVAKPSGLKADLNNAQQIRLTWKDNADNETKYVVERSANGTSMFMPAGEVPANTTEFIDTAAPLNNFLYYRVRGYHDTISSFYSDTASLAFGDVPFLMKDSTITTCNKVFMDPGGADLIPTNNYNSYYLTTTFKPGTSGKNILVAFSKFQLQSGTLYVYDGSAPYTSPLIGSYNYYTPIPAVFRATGPEGSLTFIYQGYGQNDSGWVAQVSCYKPVAKPTGVNGTVNSSNQIKLTWTDNADDETKYVVEKSVNTPSSFALVAQLGANTTQYTDSSAPANSLVYYRVRAYRDTLGSNYSDTAEVAVGNAPFIMQDSTLITCNTVFMDPGGINIIPPGNFYHPITTFKPGINGNNIRVAFSKFSLSGYYLDVYDGSSTGSPYIGRLNGNYSNSPVLNATGPEGSLTFVFQGYQSYNDSGWVAQVSCYKPVAKPTGLKAVIDNSQRINLTWTDNANDETKYVVERSVNGYSLFAPITQLAPNTTQYTDSTPPLDNFVYYRIRAYRDTLSSLPSDTASVALGNTPFLMKDSTVITCNKVFMDPAGSDVVPLVFNKATTTFKPGVSGNKIKVVFSKISVRNSLYVYDGSSPSSPLIGSFGVYSNSNPHSVFKATNAEGSLTFVYQNFLFSDTGWVAQVSCYKPVAAPGNLTADTSSRNTPRLNWTDNANNETGYIVERSVTDSLHYQPLVKLPANTTSYTDTAAPGNSFMYYRVAAYIDTSNSDYSNAVSVVTGIPFIMQNATITTCGIVFLDPGGLGNSLSGNYTATVKPAAAGNVVRVQFSEFNINGSLSVYDGPSASSPYLGYYYNSTLPPVLQSSAPGGELTFVFNSYYSDYYPGWVGYLSCYKPVLKPSNINATADSSGKINITWTDNADDETKYVVERSVNAPSLYTPVAQLPANSMQYTDSSTPANSVLYYRVRAYRDTAGSPYSDAASIAIGNAPFLMKDSVLITCDKLFLDAGGVDIVPSNTANSTRTTFKPAVPGNNIRVAFSKIKMGGNLYVYNGPLTNSPQIGYLNYYSDPSSVFNSTSADGSLTFLYYYYSSNDSGWAAQVSCYKPVARPTGVKAAADSLQKVNITWTDNANDETKYVVERSVNAPSLFKPVAQLNANTTAYTDSSAPVNSLLFYRVKAYRDTLGSFYSDTASVALGNAPFLMKDSTVITCDKIFLDAGGEDVIATTGNSYLTRTATFKPAIYGNKITLAFSKLKINGYLYVYNGSSANSPYIGYLSSYSNPLSVFSSTSDDGSLTIVYTPGYYNNDSGWVARIGCYKSVAAPSGLKAIADSASKIKLTWTDNADDETKYVIERSANASSLYTTIAQLPSNAIQYTDSTAPANSLLYYRVRAFRDTLSSSYSNPAVVGLGNAPFLMKDSTLITCNKVFMDPGGADVIPPGYYYSATTTFKPGISGNNIKVTFSTFRLNGYLYVYNGSSANSPLIGSYSTYSSVPSTILATGADGSLTFVYQGYSYNTDSGWVAQVSCYKTVAKPSGMKAIADTLQIVKVTWTDNAGDETKYVLERSVNAPSKYITVAQLPANTTQYIDSGAPANSFLFYRVKAYRDTSASFYSDTASVAVGNAPFLMKDSTVITCGKVFMDPGGIDVIPQGIYYYTHTTFKPGVAGNNVKVVFSNIALSGSLYVYNGTSTSSPLIGVLGGYNPTFTLEFSATGADGALTFLYSGSSYLDSGWVAQVSCFKPVAAPVNLTANANNQKNVLLNWTDNATDETNYSVERSFYDSLHFLPLISLSANSTSYTDTSAPENSFVFYRVRANRDSVVSAWSNTVSVLNGSVFSMRSGTLNGCGLTFLDPGGAGDYGNNLNYTTTFTSSEPVKKVKVVFTEFNTESCCDYLNVYNGPNTSSPLLGTYLGSAIPPVLQSSAPNGELTFVFTSDGSTTAQGWSASISCIKTSDTLVNCSTDSSLVNTIESNITGSTYQWQKYSGTGFINVYDDMNNAGTKTSSLHLKNAGLSVFEKFRCVVNGSLSREFVVIKGNVWAGTMSTDWNDPQNWSCGKVPDANTDVLIEGNMVNNPSLNTNGECRSIKLLRGARLNIASGYNLNIRH